MHENELIKQLQAIKVEPEKKWQDKTLQLIKIKTQIGASNDLRLNYFNLAFKNIMGGIITLIVAVLLAGGTAVASDAARPGDLF